MTLFQYITIFGAILFIIFYNIWRRNKNELIPNWPIIGMLPSVLYNQSNIHDFTVIGLKHYGGTFHFKGPRFTNIDNFIVTSDPMNVNHITSKNFNNYGKGSDFHEIFEVFGVGIFNLDSNEWKQEKKMLHSLFKRKNFEISIQQNTQKKLENCLIPFLDHASKGMQVFDLQDILKRFIFDITCTFLFGFDPTSLPYKFNELSDIACLKAIVVVEDTILYRHYIPKCIWKLQKWLQIGQEKKNMVAQQNIHQFLHHCITHSVGDLEKRLRNNQDVDESHSSLLIEIIKKCAEKGEIVEKYIRDTVFNLLAAGTISSSLSWFFWLVSTHPIVEAKIIQEIKDNCLTQDANSIANSSVKDVDNLIYLHGAICEALRLYPAVPFQHKCARSQCNSKCFYYSSHGT